MFTIRKNRLSEVVCVYDQKETTTAGVYIYYETNGSFYVHGFAYYILLPQ